MNISSISERRQSDYISECERLRREACYRNGIVLHGQWPKVAIIPQAYINNKEAFIIYCSVLGRQLIISNGGKG